MPSLAPTGGEQAARRASLEKEKAPNPDEAGPTVEAGAPTHPKETAASSSTTAAAAASSIIKSAAAAVPVDPIAAEKKKQTAAAKKKAKKLAEDLKEESDCFDKEKLEKHGWEYCKKEVEEVVYINSKSKDKKEYLKEDLPPRIKSSLEKGEPLVNFTTQKKMVEREEWKHKEWTEETFGKKEKLFKFLNVFQPVKEKSAKPPAESKEEENNAAGSTLLFSNAGGQFATTTTNNADVAPPKKQPEDFFADFATLGQNKADVAKAVSKAGGFSVNQNLQKDLDADLGGKDGQVIDYEKEIIFDEDLKKEEIIKPWSDVEESKKGAEKKSSKSSSSSSSKKKAEKSGEKQDKEEPATTGATAGGGAASSSSSSSAAAAVDKTATAVVEEKKGEEPPAGEVAGEQAKSKRGRKKGTSSKAKTSKETSTKAGGGAAAVVETGEEENKGDEEKPDEREKTPGAGAKAAAAPVETLPGMPSMFGSMAAGSVHKVKGKGAAGLNKKKQLKKQVTIADPPEEKTPADKEAEINKEKPEEEIFVGPSPVPEVRGEKKAVTSTGAAAASSSSSNPNQDVIMNDSSNFLKSNNIALMEDSEEKRKATNKRNRSDEEDEGEDAGDDKGDTATRQSLPKLQSTQQEPVAHVAKRKRRIAAGSKRELSKEYDADAQRQSERVPPSAEDDCICDAIIPQWALPSPSGKDSVQCDVALFRPFSDTMSQTPILFSSVHQKNFIVHADVLTRFALPIVDPQSHCQFFYDAAKKELRIFTQDDSDYKTFVNGELLERFQTKQLQNEDEISIHDRDTVVFVVCFDPEVHSVTDKRRKEFKQLLLSVMTEIQRASLVEVATILRKKSPKLCDEMGLKTTKRGHYSIFVEETLKKVFIPVLEKLGRNDTQVVLEVGMCLALKP
ncbi:unnamed protein product [Amoebophrya sp. A120]|nr:unnamed protein product [Amoebophrya sp. A120]|eukprot:GSA120T00009461001.1